MKTSAKYLTGLLALGLSMGGTAASAVEPAGVSHHSIHASWVWQNEPNRIAPQTQSARDAALGWLREADQAMEQGDWQRAGQAIANASHFEQQMGPNEPALPYRSADARQRMAQMQQQGQQPRQPSSQLQLPPLSEQGQQRSAKEQASSLLAQAQTALDRNDIATAQRLTAQARELRVPDDQFLANEIRPWQMELRVNAAMERRGNVAQANYQGTGQGGVQQSVYRPESNPNQFRQVSGYGDGTALNAASRNDVGSQNQASQLVENARQALAANDTIAARDYLTQAMRMQDQLDPQSRQYVHSQLSALSAPNQLGAQQDRDTGIEEIDSQQQLLLQRIGQDIFRERAVAERMVANRDPRGALEHLQMLYDRISRAEVDDSSRQYYLNIVEREIREMEQYIERNRVQIENDETNAARLQDVANRRQRNIEIESQLAIIIDDFNRRLNEGRFPEAEVLARQAHDLAPDYPEVENMMWKARFANRIAQMEAINADKEDGFWRAMRNVEHSAVPFDDSVPLVFDDARTWEQLTRDRSRQYGDGGSRTAEDMRIIQQLKSTNVNVQFDEQPLSYVLDTLGQQAGVNMDMDTRSMLDEGVRIDTPISINLQNEVSLESALHLILGKVGLTYQVRNEVVQVTTEEMKSRNVYRDTYYVGDLVIPIPNFVPTHNMGLPAAISNAYRTQAPFGRQSGDLAGINLASSDLGGAGVTGATLGQNLPGFPLGNGPNFPPNGGIPATGINQGNPGFGPGGMGGGIVADFDSLIELITNTIAVDEWDEVGGPGHIEEFAANLSLVISQTQEVHEQIQDLLDQLRRLQDLQITIEVRFITLQDDFFERIGVDFDFDIRHGQQVPQDATGVFQLPTAGGNSLTVGRQAAPSNMFNPTADLDLQFGQESFASSIPQFGNFDVNTAANFGFAILSDIEVFMLLQASKGDTRTNILQAPKVTMFNGQTASVNDTAQRPFVTSIIPVVGDFAAAQQPVIVVLNEGTQLSVQAVASNDRRFVRMTLVPFFSQIGDVEEFTFEGTETTTTGTNVVDPTNPNQTVQDGMTTTRTGTTVQLPVFGFTSVATTVSVPDGGTVLLGGIKRLQEGRNERGIPVLSNVPYVNRLFKNVGIGRTTSSLMMMVTPRIIIQEEEELAQVGAPGN